MNDSQSTLLVKKSRAKATERFGLFVVLSSGLLWGLRTGIGRFAEIPMTFCYMALAFLGWCFVLSLRNVVRTWFDPTPRLRIDDSGICDTYRDLHFAWEDIALIRAEESSVVGSLVTRLMVELKEPDRYRQRASGIEALSFRTWRWLRGVDVVIDLSEVDDPEEVYGAIERRLPVVRYAA